MTRRVALLLSALTSLLLMVGVAAPAATARSEPDVATSFAQVRQELRASLRLANRNAPLPRRYQPGVDHVARNKWVGPATCSATPDETSHDLCPLGDTSSARTVVLLGNSHLNMWVRGLQGPALAAGIRVVPLIKFGCVPYELRQLRGGRVWQECADYRDWALGQIEQLQPEAVILSSHRDFGVAGPDGQRLEGRAVRRAWSTGVQQTVDRVRAVAPSTQARVLGDVNYRSIGPVRCLRSRRASMRFCESPLTRATTNHNGMLSGAAAAAGATFWDPNPLLCLRGRCPLIADGSVMYWHTTHVSRRWSMHVGALLASRLGLAS